MPITGRRTDRVERHYEWALGAFRAVVGSASTLDENVVRKAFDKLEQRYRPSSVNYIYKVCADRLENWPQGLKYQYSQQDVRQTMVKVEALGRMVKAAQHSSEPLHAAYLALASVYGMRLFELARVEARDINVDQGWIFVRTAKGGVQRKQLMHPDIAPWIAGIEFEPVSEQKMNGIFRFIEAVASIPHEEHVGWHSIRRTLVTELAKVGMHPAMAKKFLRWKDADIQEHYVVYDFDIDRQAFAVHPFAAMWKKEN